MSNKSPSGTTDAQKKASERWIKKNPQKKRFSSMYSTAKSFARHYARTRKEVEELLDIYDEENPNSPIRGEGK